jgi:hypothetical protein
VRLRRTYGSFALAFVLVWSTTASAEPPPAAPSAADIAKARSIFDAGGRAYDAGDYPAAIQAFEQAYAIAKRDNIVFSIAQAHRQQFILTGEADHLTKAIASYRQFLAGGKAGPRKAEATKAQTDLEAIEAKREKEGAAMPAPVAAPAQKTMLAIDSPTPGARISIDGSEPAPPQVNAEVTAGPHKVKISAPGDLDKEVTVRANAGEFTPETFELEEKPAHLSVDVPSGAEVSIDGRFFGKAPFAKPFDVPPGRRFVSVTLGGHQSKGEVVELERGADKKLALPMRTTTQRDVSYAFMTAGGAALVGSLVLTGLAVASDHDASLILKKQQSSTITQRERQQYTDDAANRDKYRNAAISVGVGAGVLGVIGLGLFAFDRPSAIQAPPDTGPAKPKDEPRERKPRLEMRVVPSFGLDEGGAVVLGRF